MYIIYSDSIQINSFISMVDLVKNLKVNVA